VVRDDAFRGFLPKGVSKENLWHIAQTGVRKRTAAPLEVDGELLLLESMREASITVSRPTAPLERSPFKTIPLRGSDVPTFGSPYAAVGTKSVGAVVVNGKQAYFVLIDPRSWTAKRIVNMKVAPPETIIGMDQPAIGFGDGKYGVVVGGIGLTERNRNDWGYAAWAIFDEKGEQVLATTLMKASPSRYSRQIIWTGSTFAVLGPRSGEGETSLGLYTLPSARNGSVRFTPLVEPDPDPLKRWQVRDWGAAVVESGEIHVAVERSHGTDRELLVAHANGSGDVRMEKCRE